jgi:transposase
MSRLLKLRSLSEEEEKQIKQLASSKTQSACLVQRAKIIQCMLDNPKMSAKEASFLAGYKSDLPGRTWVKRFNEKGINGLNDQQRSGHPLIHTQDTRGSLISLALQKPRSLGYPFELWTLLRLQTAFKEQFGVYICESAIWNWLSDEGLKWKRQQSWFHDTEKHDPEFVEKRGQ